MANVFALGQTVTTTGCFTRLSSILGAGSEELSRRIGFRRGRLAQGFLLGLMKTAPRQDQLELLGYSHFSDGRIGAPSADPLVEAGRIKVETDLAGVIGVQGVADQRQRLSGAANLSGPDRYVKVYPLDMAVDSARPDLEFPPGSGIPQWRLLPGGEAEFFLAAKVVETIWSLADGRQFDVSRHDYRQPLSMQPISQVRSYLGTA